MRGLWLRRNAVFCIPSFLCSGGGWRLRPEGQVHLPTTMVQPSAKLMILPPMAVFLFHSQI